MERPEPGQAVEVEVGLRMVLAPNPSPMTYWGTNTWIVGQRGLAIIDPGPDDTRHLEALLRAIGGSTVSHVIVTHAHLDHAPLARRLASATRAPVLAFGDAASGRSATMKRLADLGLAGGGEGVDADFRPDICLADDETLEGDGWRLRALHTPGHFASHLGFALGDAVFSGDHVMGWASSLVSPPDGDMGAFMATSERLAGIAPRVFYPGHGAPVRDTAGRLDWLMAHRRSREAAILDALSPGPATIPVITARVYTDIPLAMMPAAERNVLAHLIDLKEKSQVAAEPEPGVYARYARL